MRAANHGAFRGIDPVARRDARPPIPWRAVWALLQPARAGLAGMVALSLAGSLIGLIPPLWVGFLVDDLVGRGHGGGVTGWAAVIAFAVAAEAGAYVLSDGLYARVAGRLFRDVRLLMFEGLLAGPPGGAGASGIASRFVSDAETMEELTVAALDQAAVGVFDLVAALAALGALDALSLGAVAGVLLAAVLVFRRTRAPAAGAGKERQEALEGMSRTLAAALARRAEPGDARGRFRAAVERVLRSDVRLGWLSAANRHGSRALVGLGPIAVVVTAGLHGGHRAGALLSLYLLAGRAFQGAETLLDLSLDVELVRGAVERCFALVERGRPPLAPAADF